MIIQLNNLVCYANEIALCKPITLSAGAGCLVILQGPNGAGKSTLLRSLAGIVTNVTGKIKLSGAVCYVGHEIVLHENLNVGENLQNILRLEDLSACSAQINARVTQALLQLGLRHKQRAYPWQLSKGQQHKLNLAKLLFSPNSIWLLDEPLVHLDIAAQALLLGLLREHLQGKCLNPVVVISSHTPIALAGVDVLTVKIV